MRPLLRSLLGFFTSLTLTVWLLGFSLVLVFVATLAQTDLGIWAVQQRFFWSLFVMVHLPGTSLMVPVFPGGYLIGGLLLVNLVAAHLYRFRFGWRKSGIWLTHLGLILLLLGELFTGIWQRESLMRIDQGQTKPYSESRQRLELAVVDTTDAASDHVIAVPAEVLARGGTIQYARLPFTIHTLAYYPNSTLQSRSRSPGAAPSPADQGFGPDFVAAPQPITYRPDEDNLPSAFVELSGPEGRLGTWLVSALFAEPQGFSYQGRSWQLMLRPKRYYYPFSLTLLKFSHDRYPGTDIPKNFSSRVRLQTPDGRVDREVLIYMNNPLRYAGLTFYQAGFENNDRTTVLQVVRNPSWLLPYVSCVMMFFGLLIQFGIHLFGFISRRAVTAPPAPAPARP